MEIDETTTPEVKCSNCGDRVHHPRAWWINVTTSVEPPMFLYQCSEACAKVVAERARIAVFETR